jgi:hypothetical protein
MIAAAEGTWPGAAVAIAGIALVIAVIVTLIVTVGATIRARTSVQREAAYRKLADDSIAAQSRTSDQLERALAELTELRMRTGELERMLKTVE